jgi:hypothetical protein
MATIYLMLSAKFADAMRKEKKIRIMVKHGKIDQQSIINILILPEHWETSLI